MFRALRNGEMRNIIVDATSICQSSDGVRAQLFESEPEIGEEMLED